MVIIFRSSTNFFLEMFIGHISEPKKFLKARPAYIWPVFSVLSIDTTGIEIDCRIDTKVVPIFPIPHFPEEVTFNTDFHSTSFGNRYFNRNIHLNRQISENKKYKKSNNFIIKRREISNSPEKNFFNQYSLGKFVKSRNFDG